MSAHLASLQGRIAAACRDARRNTEDVTFIGVSKTRAAEDIRPLLAAGLRHFGENRVQEAADKWPALRAQYPDITLHAIGRLQSNKAASAVALFDVIHTLDRVKLADALSDEMQKQNRPLPCFIQVNTGDEKQKGGIAPDALEDFYAYCTKTRNINVTGLMCIPPADDIAALHFALLKKYAARLGLSALSMGMSADFESALRLGATHIRVGSALFSG